jgi:hypothetical protein
VAPDYERAIRRLDEIGYMPDDPRRAVGVAVVRRGRPTSQPRGSRGLSPTPSLGSPDKVTIHSLLPPMTCRCGGTATMDPRHPPTSPAQSGSCFLESIATW